MRQRDTWGRAGAVGIGVGIGVALAVPFMRGNEKERRRILKGLVRAYCDVGDVLRERVAETGERLSDLVAEVNTERAFARTALRFAGPLARTALRHGPLLLTAMSALRPLLARR